MINMVIHEELEQAKAKSIELEERIAKALEAIRKKYLLDDADDVELLLAETEFGWRDIRAWDCLGDVMNRQSDLIEYIDNLASGIDDDGRWVLMNDEKFIRDCKEDIREAEKMISDMNGIVSACKRLGKHSEQKD